MSKEPSSSRTQTAAMALAAISTAAYAIVVSKGQPMQSWAWIIGICALAAFGWVLLPPLLASIASRRKRKARDSFAKDKHEDFLRLVERLNNFVNVQDGGNLRNILGDLCGTNQTTLGTVCPPDYLRELYPAFLDRQTAHRATNAAELTLALSEFYSFVASYNAHYVLEPLERLRRGDWPPGAPESWRQRFVPHIEGFRERWVRFLDDTQLFLADASKRLEVAALPVYFERPVKLELPPPAAKQQAQQAGT
jgi:hypothetical protein